MRKIGSILMASVLVAGLGCTQGTPGGPGVTNRTETQVHTTGKPVVTESTKPVVTESTKPVVTESKDTFSLHVPIVSTSLKQGDTKSMDISVKPGSTFDQDVKLTFTDIPTGITLDPANPIITHNDKQAKISVSAADNAAVGDFTVKVTGHPMKGGADAHNEFKLSISAK